MNLAHQGVQGLVWGAEGALSSGLQVWLWAGRGQMQGMVTTENTWFIYHGSNLAELEGELTNDLCSITSTRVRATAPQGV